MFEPADDEKLVFPEAQVRPVAAPRKREERVVSLFDDYDDYEEEEDAEDIPAQEEFKPLNFENIDEEIASFAAAASVENDEALSETLASQDEPLEDIPSNAPRRRENTLIYTPESARARSKKTFIPVQDVDPDNIFMDEPEEFDEYDAYDEDSGYSGGFDDEDDYEYEDRVEGSFFRRHIRGIVGLLLLLMLAAICLIWASTTKGQTVLAKMNLAWDAEVYAELGYEAYQNNSDLQAARYYEKAYSRDAGNYTYAHSAMVAYYEADQLENATSMLKICVELQPNNPEPYAEFLILYPDPMSRPWEITEKIRDGYQRTGDERLNIG